MNRIGLALSGGGFRATLYHLGMIRFLRDAGVLRNVTHITSVSGGSILAAHLVLNWDRYTDSEREFEEAAAELIRFVQLDIRNRVVRRYPLAVPLRAARRLAFQRPDRQLTRTGLLEYHYEKYLYGDTCLFELPERPRLYILATNLSEGCLCAFTRDGLLMQRRQPGQQFRFERIQAGLATVPMAVTASSAFPGFFPPLQLQAQDVAADPGQFSRLAFTDGGIYDNLGVRMMRCLEQSWLAREIHLVAEDLADVGGLSQVFQSVASCPEDTPLRRLQQMVSFSNQEKSPPILQEVDPTRWLVEGLDCVMRHENLSREPAFASLEPPDPAALPLLKASQQNASMIDAGEQLWLNRQLVDAAIRQSTGKPCFRSLNACFDAVLVSDAGKKFRISADTRAGGLITTAMRSTDIAMNRVWQLEVDTFTGTPGFVFAPIGSVVGASEDPTAMHPEVQRRAADIRTDLDRFTPLEISALVRHGYCVGRHVVRSRPDLFGTEVPVNAPWDPMASGGNTAVSPPPHAESSQRRQVALETDQSRTLQKSGARRIWGTLLDFRDWISCVYVPLLVPILIVLPYYALQWYQQTQVAQRLVESMAHSNHDYAVMRDLLQDGFSPPFDGLEAVEALQPTPPDYSGFEVIADTRVFDLRPWKVATAADGGTDSWAYGYRRIRLQKLQPDATRFVILLRMPTSRIALRPLDQQHPVAFRALKNEEPQASSPLTVFEVEFDLSKVPARDVVDLSFEMQIHDISPVDNQLINFYVDAETGLLSYWLLLPQGKRAERFELLRYANEKGQAPVSVIPAHQLDAVGDQMLAFTLLSLKPGLTYECRWAYQK